MEGTSIYIKEANNKLKKGNDIYSKSNKNISNINIITYNMDTGKFDPNNTSPPNSWLDKLNQRIDKYEQINMNKYK